MVKKKLISWVLPIFNEEKNLPQLFSAIEEFEKKLNAQYAVEFIFIDDGSRDNSFAILRDYFEQKENVIVLSQSRNFGHQMAITAGLDHAQGDAIIFMDADLQDPPAVCYELIREWESGYDVVYAKRRSRKDGFLKKLTAHLFYRVLRMFAEIDIPEDVGDFRLISRKVADTLRTFKERHRFIRGLVSYIGFKQKAVLFDRENRKAGESGYSLKKMLRLAEDALTGFSVAPIMLVGTAGSILAFAGIIGAIIALITMQTLVLALSYATILTGIILISLATIGQYVGRTYQQVQGRPLYILKEKLVHTKNNE